MTVRMKCVVEDTSYALTLGRVYEGVVYDEWFHVVSNDGGYPHRYRLWRFGPVDEAAPVPAVPACDYAYMVIFPDYGPGCEDWKETFEEALKAAEGHHPARIYQLVAETGVVMKRTSVA